MKKILKGLYYGVKTLLNLNIIKTLYLNFRCLPLSQALKFPIYIYGKIEFYDLNGKININSNEIERGMIRIGYKWLDLVPFSTMSCIFSNTGYLEFKGKTIIGGGVSIFVDSEPASLIFSDRTKIGSGSFVKACNFVSIGYNTRLTYGTILMDCDMHFVKNIDTGKINKNFGTIFIGSNCWLNGSTIMKGAILPDFCVSTRNSLLNKDYSVYGNHLFLVGCPAEPKSNRVQRIFSIKYSHFLTNYFKTNPECDNYQAEKGAFLEDKIDECLFN